MTAIVRRGPAGHATWENFEYLYIRSKEWDERYPNGNYPAHVKRAILPDRYLSADLAYQQHQNRLLH